MEKQCGIILPRQELETGYRTSEYLAECILKGRHGYGPHVIRTPDGELYAWEDDMKCDCCEPGEECHCYIIWKITEQELPLYQEGATS